MSAGKLPVAKPGTAGKKAAARPGAETFEMQLGEILELYNIGIGNLALGHAGLNGYNKAVGERIMLQPYSLTDEVRQNITRVKFHLRPFAEDVDADVRKQITREVMIDTDTPNADQVPKEDAARTALWHRRYSEHLKVRHEVTLHVFERTDFFRDNKNPIPNETEIALYPITRGSPWREVNLPAEADSKPEKPAEPTGGE